MNGSNALRANAADDTLFAGEVSTAAAAFAECFLVLATCKRPGRRGNGDLHRPFRHGPLLARGARDEDRAILIREEMPMWSILLRERRESGGRRAVDASPDRRSERPYAGRGALQAPSRSRPRHAGAAGASLRQPPPAAWPDPRRLTPREMRTLSHRLYMAGDLGLEDSRLLSCQSELHPDYATTVARLTGRAAVPDAPRDHIEDWERRLAFALRFGPQDPERISGIRRILAALERLAASTSPSSSPPPCRRRE